ncbi:Sugar diacid regulator [Leminorella richardii]|uniref:Sugar diacid regulator n=1 Tax=Leminorella richardii TaxID=158841 RepID=A0A2X4UU91_9GAMM|nr:CdaR family transcriptional regulator [Leminorella richardii]SQI42371.1 Sugar diacid regulator [Leminorella richardii]
MSFYHLDAKLAQDIVNRTMQIIDSNINVMDAKGTIIGSGDINRIGELHEGALLALSQGRIVEINDAVAASLRGVKPGINLPLRVEGDIVGVIGLTGEPNTMRQNGQLVSMAAEMMLEQARLLNMLAQDSRMREALVLNLIRSDELPTALIGWAQRLGIDLTQPRIVTLIELESGSLGVEVSMTELQQVQTLLTMPDRDNLIAIVSLNEMVVLQPALNSHGRWDADEHRRRVDSLLQRMSENTRLKVSVALGNHFSGPGSVARSYSTAKAAMSVGKKRMPEQRSYYYQDLMLPVLLDSLRGGWQVNELSRPLSKLKAMDNNGLLRRTLLAWFKHNMHPGATVKSLYIHRNTLDYRLNRISDITGLNLKKFDDHMQLYIALQLDEE